MESISMMRRGLQCLLVLAVLFPAACNSGTTPSKAPPVGNIDLPETGIVITGPVIEVRGWVLDSVDAQPIINVSVDGQRIEEALQRAARTDVCTQFPDIKHCATSNPGFSGT